MNSEIPALHSLLKRREVSRAADTPILFLGTEDDKPYLPRLKSIVGGATIFVVTQPISTFVEVSAYCKSKGITKVFTTSQTLLEKLTFRDGVKIANFAGSLFSRDGIEFVIFQPLRQLVSVSYGSFVARRYLSKLTHPEDWIPATKFYWEMLTPENVEEVFNKFHDAILITADIETFKENLAIRCIGYTAIFSTVSGELTSHSVVLPVDSEWALSWMRKFNWELPAPKGFQNGKYDIAYLARYNAPIYNYLFDTINMSHCWYVELPKDLAFITTFFVRESWYWKDMADTNDLFEYYEYNARDTWGTANSIIAWLMQAPDWAKNNYLQEFPLVFPSHMCEMRGIKVDKEAFQKAKLDIANQITELSKKLDRLLGVTNFNVNSPVQMKALFKILGCGDLPSQDEKNIGVAQFRHPLNNLILGIVLEIRGLRKLVSTYLVDEKVFNGRFLYAINPHQTDTGRNASREHHFWTGLNIQNIPRGQEVKQAICADSGYVISESDLEQAESRDTAHIAGDEKLIAAVSGGRDFHSVNAAAFFGRNYEDIYDEQKGKTRNKPLRDLAKRVNHGANYNMGANVLVQTMGLENIYNAAKMLGLPKLYTPRQIAEHLLTQFHKTYPSLSYIYYTGVIHDIETTKLLVGATGWTRYCFGDPRNNKSDLNAYVAHPPQSLNAMVLNKAFMEVFYKIALHPVHANNFKLNAQIHDSILFQFRKGHEYLAEEVKKAMEIPVTVKGYDGKVRTFTVPAALKAGKDGKGATHWSKTE